MPALRLKECLRFSKSFKIKVINKMKQIWDNNKIIFICLFCASLIFLIDSFIPLGVAGGVPYILIILISLWSDKVLLPVFMAIIGSLLTVLGFFTSPPGGELWKVLSNRSLALFAIWTTAILSVQRTNIHEQKEKALLEIKKLTGLLPICASCKKIRDDKGYWNQIELYIRDRSEVEFSHGICPDCAKKLYPDLKLHNIK
jgi:hypothetical protein